MTLARVEGLSDCIANAIREHLAKVPVAWPLLDQLVQPTLRIEAFLEDGSNNSFRALSEKVASRILDLTGIVTPAPSRSPITHLDGTDPNLNDDLRSLPRRTTEEQDEDAQADTSLPRGSYERQSSEDTDSDYPRRKATSGLRPAIEQSSFAEDQSERQRQMQSNGRAFPKRRKVASDSFALQPSTLDKLIVGIWEQIHGSINLDLSSILDQFQVTPMASQNAIEAERTVSTTMIAGSNSNRAKSVAHADDSFNRLNIFCRNVTQASRVCRSFELIVQARWIELFELHVQAKFATNPEISVTKHRKATLMEACEDFGWSEKELRNKLAVWRGYKEVKDAAGWAALVFAGMGLYRFCKYRVGFDKDAIKTLSSLRPRFEVAADTLHPNWRQLLSVIGESSHLVYQGHPHDWVVFEDGTNPIDLRSTYLQYDPYFSFDHLDESVIDEDVWGCDDPRWIPRTPASTEMIQAPGLYICEACRERQSDDPKLNSCYCFPSLYGCSKSNPAPLQVFRTSNGRNNGLIALTGFERGAAIGEFIGLITKNLSNLDVMDSSTPHASYQIWQGKQGNYTRFVNHSCKANAQFQQFVWCDTQRVVLVSNGIQAGEEVTVDYSDRYWGGLDKKCLCGQPCCRYRRDVR